jgi:hypothetical protein
MRKCVPPEPFSGRLVEPAGTTAVEQRVYLRPAAPAILGVPMSVQGEPATGPTIPTETGTPI